MTDTQQKRGAPQNRRHYTVLSGSRGIRADQESRPGWCGGRFHSGLHAAAGQFVSRIAAIPRRRGWFSVRRPARCVRRARL